MDSRHRPRGAVLLIGHLIPLFAALLGWPASRPLADVVDLPASRDNTLIQDPAGAWSNGAGPAIFAGRTSQASGSIRRAVIAFDVAGSVPEGSTITAAILSLNLTSGNEGPSILSLHTLLAEWGEGASLASGGRGAASTPGDATWVHTFYDQQFWEQAGGDFAAEPGAEGVAEASGPVTWGSTPGMVADVQAWLDIPTLNHGWIVIGDELSASTVRRFDSRESADPRLRPSLRIEYAPPCMPAPLGAGYWQHQCMTESGLDSGLLACADALVEELGTGASACETIASRAVGGVCEQASRQLASLAFDLCAGRLQTSCMVQRSGYACSWGRLGDLLPEWANLLREGDCLRALRCATAGIYTARPDSAGRRNISPRWPTECLREASPARGAPG